MSTYASARIAILIAGMGGLASAQVQQPAQRLEKEPVFRIDVVARTTKAINYQHRSGATTIGFKGTSLMPGANGEAKVESKKGYIEIEVEFDDLKRPGTLGPEFLTYVLWAITPEGRAQNLGELLVDGNRGKLNVTTELQVFGLVVTAEPYFAVTAPSDVIVLENVVRPDTRGRVEEVVAKYELLQRGQYVRNLRPESLSAFVPDGKVPLELVEARNAIHIARGAEADKWAAETFDKAVGRLKQAEDYHARKQKKPSTMVAREAVQTAEDARLIAIKRIEEDRLTRERQAAAQREAAATARADQEAIQRARADQERLAAEQQKADAIRERLDAERQRAAAEARRAEAEREKAEAEAERVAALNAKQDAEKQRMEAERQKLLADSERQKALQQQQNAEKERQAAEEAKLAADKAREAALEAQRQAKEEADKARQAAEEANRLRAQSEQEKAQLRERLLQQLNTVLQTRATARGLIVNVSDVLFDTAKYTLKPGAREKLARVAGIVAAHPGLMLQVEGHTDSVGTDEYNQTLSENRARSVRDFLLQQGIASGSITAKGYGETAPVATNDTAAGRQQNRRVELVVSGQVLGVETAEPTAGGNPR